MLGHLADGEPLIRFGDDRADPESLGELRDHLRVSLGVRDLNAYGNDYEINDTETRGSLGSI